MPVPTSSQPVPTTRSASAKQNPNLTAPQSVRMGGSPMSYGAMTGGAGFSFDRPKSVKFGFNPGSYGSRFYGDAGGDSSANFSTSITMGSPSYGNSFIASASAFNLPPSSLSSSYQRRSYADAAARRQTNPNMLSSSIASLSMSYSNPQMGMSFGSYSYSKHQVHRLIDNPDAELARSYECCGLKHAGLHALLEHVEDAHPTLDDDMPMNHGFTPMTHAMDLDLEEIDEEPTLERAASGTGSTRSSLSPHPIPSYPLPPSAGSSKATTPNEHPVNTPMSISDMLTSPPGVDSKINAAARSASTCSSPPDGSLATPTTSSQPSPVFAPPKIGGPRTGFLGTVPRVGHQQRLDRAFNEVVAGKKDQPAENQLPGVTAVAPGVLFASAVAGLGIPTTPPTGQKPQGQDITNDTPNVEGTPSNTATAEPPLPQPSLFSTHKPWRCPNPGCNKAYKQSNGLKYHQQKGQCDFAIHDAVDLGLTVEEAEERNRPFVCAVGAGCNKRYRQMNGLKVSFLFSIQSTLVLMGVTLLVPLPQLWCTW
ncbi:hypothetical protein BCR39DRAFT_236708 [Naematelia encephala]|uniref:C2H2-type domain-containing protein n=1 Tax=Naematelia encephala TaxID=71784 RepID=A0A1Y2BH28_9TREE|nr:hypothetical protein BCR39DRAFT_236708 [Naematelia encephala]